MSITIYALDYQFAAATGANVNSAAGSSTFDYPPNSTKDLVIQSQSGDPSPYIFSPGDVYTISFGGHGATTIENATIIRSDFIDIGGDTGYAVVFEGLDISGNLTQVVWTPEFDLETWYWDNFDAGNPPGFYTTDNTPETYQIPCFDANTHIETPNGMQAIGSLTVGDLVMTQDRGAQPIRWLGRFDAAGKGRAMPVWIETGTLGNTRPLLLSRQHRVLLKNVEPSPEFEHPEVLVPVVALLNGATIRLTPKDTVFYVHLLLDRHEIISAEGCPCETLLLRKTTERHRARRNLPGMSAHLAHLTHIPARPLLTVREGTRFWQRLQASLGRERAMFGRRGRSRARPYLFKPCISGPRKNCMDSIDA